MFLELKSLFLVIIVNDRASKDGIMFAEAIKLWPLAGGMSSDFLNVLCLLQRSFSAFLKSSVVMRPNNP